MSKKSNASKSTKKLKDEKQHRLSVLPGWPGDRNRAGRSGYDPIDTRAEAGHMAGTFLQTLFVGQIRNWVHLFLLGVLGLILITPLVLAISETWTANPLAWNAWLFVSVVGIAGLAILINFIKNLLGIFIR